MGQVKEINIKNQTYYFFNDMTDIKNFHSNLLKIDKKSDKDIDVYYIGYITIKKFGDYGNIHSVNQLTLRKQANQKCLCFVIIGILKTLVIDFNHIFEMVAMLCQ